MPSFFSKTLSLLTGSPSNDIDFSWLTVPSIPVKSKKNYTKRELIKLESQIGAEIFGPLPKGHTREFFNLDPTTWIWYEEWIDQNRLRQHQTTKYEVHGNGILKVSDGANYNYVDGDELLNLKKAIEIYYQRISREIYHVDPDTGVPVVSA